MPDRGAGRPARAGPRVLVTGFSVFPGAPVNPTEWLAVEIARHASDFAGRAEIVTEVLAVDYRALPARLEEIGRAVDPDIAIHFGLSAQARGFVLERAAHNRIATHRLDNAGYRHPTAFIHESGPTLASTLPLAAIHSRLASLALPASFSDSAGDYLCNYLFYLARSAHFSAYAPGMAGFIHVPPFPGDRVNGLCQADLLAGAIAVIETCCEAWTTAA